MAFKWEKNNFKFFARKMMRIIRNAYLGKYRSRIEKKLEIYNKVQIFLREIGLKNEVFSEKLKIDKKIGEHLQNSLITWTRARLLVFL